MKTNILLVDDNRHLRVTLGDHLTHEGYHVTTAESGEAALRVLDERQPDLIILDINMPGMGGVGLLRRLVDPTRSRMKYPVIVLTARSAMESFFDTVPVDGFLPKPCPLATLMEKIEEVLACRAADATPPNRRILLAEDDPVIVEQVVRFLSEAGYTVEVAGSGPDVLEKAARSRPALILLKQLLPKMNGNVAAPILANMPSLVGVPMVLYDNTQEYQDPEMFTPRIPDCVTHYVASSKAHELLHVVHQVLGGPRA